MTIRPLSSAGIILSYKCNSKCRHCLYCCSNEWNGWMDTGLLRSICEGTIASTRAMHGFHLAGGEAFLNFSLLLEAVEIVTEYSIPINYVETNAGWFTDMDSAVEKLSRLRNAGLNCLLISASPFHSEYIPIEKTLGAIQASIEVFGRSGTMIWLPEFLSELMDIRTEGKIGFEEYVESVGDRGARIAAAYGGQLIPGGRSPFTLSDYLPQQPKEAFFGGNCEYELLRSGSGHFDLYGNIICGVCSGISMGDAHDLEMAYNSFDMESHPVVMALCSGGIEQLYQIAAHDYGFKAKEAYAGKCSLCADIRRYLVLRGAEFDELKPKDFYLNIR